ncbi:pigment-dispersing hormone A peptides [Anopheles bellator]|uniref:pigment-dispersing hormone A peptides n=1 Tax=Anopheles bellator TaxID=139047 RepID=UPI0026493BC0|nr:pigment-dispersing hormone A peptides [Anopheles bellator]
MNKNTMANVSVVCVLLFCVYLRVSGALPAFADDRDFNKELYIRQLPEWFRDQPTDFLSEPVVLPLLAAAYEYRQPINVGPSATHVKRNSELINSLLSLPKTMNDAGK